MFPSVIANSCITNNAHVYWILCCSSQTTVKLTQNFSLSFPLCSSVTPSAHLPAGFPAYGYGRSGYPGYPTGFGYPFAGMSTTSGAGHGGHATQNHTSTSHAALNPMAGMANLAAAANLTGNLANMAGLGSAVGGGGGMGAAHLCHLPSALNPLAAAAAAAAAADMFNLHAASAAGAL